MRVDLAILATLFFCACGGQPIGRVVVPGTTIAIPVPPSYYGGFGLRIGTDPATAPAYDENHPLEDAQRGELLFKLVQLPSEAVYGYLPRRWITRVAIDESALEAINGSFNAAEGQVIAFVDIPVDVDDGDYEIRVERHRRDPASPTRAFVQTATTIDVTIPFAGLLQDVPWNGWGGWDPSAGIPIQVQGPPANPPKFTELMGWADVFGEYRGTLGALTNQELRNHTPYPSFRIGAGTYENLPAAVEMEFDYPINRMRIRGVKVTRDGPSGAIVRWDAEDPDAIVGCSAPPGRLKIMMIDPDREAAGVEVAYELRNFAQPCGDRIVPSEDIEPVASTFKAYDEDGILLSGIAPVIIDLDR